MKVKDKKMKIDKILISIALVVLLFLVLTLTFLFFKNKFSPEVNIMEPKNIAGEEKFFNLDKEKVIKNPSEKDISDLINDLKAQSDKLEVE